MRNSIDPVSRTILRPWSSSLLWAGVSACFLLLPLPGSAQSVRGVWVGPWENSLGQRGEGRLVVTEEFEGTVRGEWDGLRFEGRRREGEMTFRIRDARDGCLDYDGRVVFYGGDAGRLTYEARNRCTEPHNYSGWQRLTLVDERPRGREFRGSIRGVWRGPWENSLGERGESTWVVTRDFDGMVRGTWGDDPFEGRRNGDEITFQIQGAQKGCTDYEGLVRIFEGGDTGRLTYEAHNHCSGRRYSGSHRIRLAN